MGHAGHPRASSMAAAARRTSDSVIGGRTPRSAPRVTRSTQRPLGSPRDFQFDTDDGPQPSCTATAPSPPRASSISSRDRAIPHHSPIVNHRSRCLFHHPSIVWFTAECNTLCGMSSSDHDFLEQLCDQFILAQEATSLSQGAFHASRVGLSGPQVTNIKKHRNPPSHEAIRNACREFGFAELVL